LEFLLSQAQARWRTAEAAVVMVAAASVEEAFTAAASVEEVSAAALMVAGFTVALTAVAFAAVGSTIATSTIDSSSLAILGTRSFTIPIHITATIPTAIILMVTDTVAFVAVAFVAVAFAVVAFVVVAFVAVGDPYNQPVYQGSGGYTDSLIGRVQLRLARAGYYYGSIDSVSDSGTRAEADP